MPPQLPLLPDVTSNRPDVCEYGYEPYVVDVPLPARAYTAAMIGALALVPPTVPQPLKHSPWS